MKNDLLLAGVSERAVNVIDTASILDLGIYNRVHRHLMGNYIFYWVTFGMGLLLFTLTFGLENFGYLKEFLYAILIHTIYWIWLLNWVIPRFWQRIIKFLTVQHGPLVGDDWAMFVNILDIQAIITLAQNFDYFTYERMMLLASRFDDLSQKAKMFSPPSPGVTAWGSAIFGTLVGGLLLEATKHATPLEFNLTMALLCITFLLTTGYAFFCNGSSRRHARTAELLRKAAALAPR